MTSLFSSVGLANLPMSPAEAKAFRTASTKHVFEDAEAGLRLTFYRRPDGHILLDDISLIPVPSPSS